MLKLCGIGILKFLLPNETKFFVMLNNQSSVLLEGANLFFNSINNYNELNEKQREEARGKLKGIGKKEKKEVVSHQIIEQIDKNFITPFDREDIHQLTVLVEDLIDIINATFKRITLYNLRKTDEIIIQLNRLILDSVKRNKLCNS